MNRYQEHEHNTKNISMKYEEKYKNDQIIIIIRV